MLRKSCKVIGIAALALAGATVGASAGGSIKDGPYTAPSPIWTGLYIGAHGGGARSHADWEFPLAGSTANHKGNGAFGGGQIGYNWQSGSLVFGVEADISGAGIDGTTPCPNPAFNCGHDIDMMASLRARFGVLVTPTALLYVTGGAGWVSVDWKVTDAATGMPTGAGGFSETASGWTLGAGLEWKFDRNWSLKGEYIRYDLGTASATPGTAPSDLGLKVDTFRVGLNYKLF
jgi:outer membrane immunogenic protein